jgi:hypothetical protein
VIIGTPADTLPLAKQLTSVFPNLVRMVPCPLGADTFAERCAAGCLDRPVVNQIIHLNDHHAWTREQIADWLDSLPLVFTAAAATKGD